MNTNNRPKFGFVICTALLGTLTGCIGSVDGPRREAVYVQPPTVQVETGIVVQDDYVYYPGYQVYYSSNRRQYVYLEGGLWVTRQAPPRVSAEVLFASPSVRMDFHDSPANHHTTIIRTYPRTWREPVERRDNRGGDNRGGDNRGGDNRGGGNRGDDRKDKNGGGQV